MTRQRERNREGCVENECKGWDGMMGWRRGGGGGGRFRKEEMEG